MNVGAILMTFYHRKEVRNESIERRYFKGNGLRKVWLEQRHTILVRWHILHEMDEIFESIRQGEVVER